MELTVEQKIEQMLKDTQKNLATKDELRTAVAEVVKEEEAKQALAHKTEIDQVKADLALLQKANEELKQMAKRLIATRFADIKDADGHYNGIWGSHQMAKDFGLFVMSEVIGIPEAKSLFAATGLQCRTLVGGRAKAVAAGENVTGGGALAPSEFIPRLVSLIGAFSAYRQLAESYPLGAGDNSVPVQTGDPTVYCPGAGVAATEGSLGFKTLGLNPLEWVSYVLVNRDLSEDSAILVGELVGRSLARAFGNMEDKCGFIGDGTSTYFNITGARAGLRAVDATVTNIIGLKVQDTAGAWSAIDLQDILAVAGLLSGDFDIAAMNNDVAWVTSKNFYLTVMVNAALGAGGSRAQEVIQTGYTRTPTFLGYPVKYGGGMPRVKPSADHCPLLFGNWKLGAALGDRRQFVIEQSREVKFLERQTAIMGTERIAINNFGVGDTTDAGPIVGFWADIA